MPVVSNAKPSETSMRQGHCLCQNVRFDLAGDPFTFYVCHCKNCKRQTGSAFMANIFFKEHQLTVVEGKQNIKEYFDTDTDSGALLTRSFCTNCGSSLFMKPSIPKYADVILVPSGLIDDTSEWVPKCELYSDEKRGWISVLDVVAGSL